MAGMGPAPAEDRRRRNVPARGDWIDLPPLEEVLLPELPARADGEDWSDRTRFTWDAWRLDPVTQMWSPSDVAYALDTILLYDGLTSANGANEVRLRMDGLGLTPKGKKDLRWRVQREAELVASGSSAKRARGSDHASRRRANLSVVK